MPTAPRAPRIAPPPRHEIPPTVPRKEPAP